MKRYLIVILFLFSAPAYLYAQIEKITMNVDEIVSNVLSYNPQYKAFRNKVSATRERSWWQSAWDDPKIGIRWNDIPTEQFLTEAKQKRWFVMQTFPFPGKLSLKGKIVDKQADIEQEQLDQLRLRLTASAKEAFYKLYFTYQSIEINEENQRLLEKFQKIANRKYSVGKASQQDVLKAMVELSRLTNDLLTLKQVKETWVARLNTLMNRKPDAPIGRPVITKKFKFEHKLDGLEKLALQYRQSVRAAQIAVQKKEKEKLLAGFSYAPDFFTRFEYWDNESKRDMWGAEIGISVPLWFWHRQIPQVKDASAQLAETQATQREVTNQTLFEIKDAFVRLNTARRLWTLYETTVITQAAQSLKAAESGYQTDKVDFLNLIESQRILENFKLELHRAISDVFIALAQLETAVGKDFD